MIVSLDFVLCLRFFGILFFGGVHEIEVVVFILWFSWCKIIDPILISVVVLGRIVTLLNLFLVNVVVVIVCVKVSLCC